MIARAAALFMLRMPAYAADGRLLHQSRRVSCHRVHKTYTDVYRSGVIVYKGINLVLLHICAFFLASRTSFIRRYLLIIWYDSIFITRASTFTSEALACGRRKDFVNFAPFPSKFIYKDGAKLFVCSKISLLARHVGSQVNFGSPAFFNRPGRRGTPPPLSPRDSAEGVRRARCLDTQGRVRERGRGRGGGLDNWS